MMRLGERERVVDMKVPIKKNEGRREGAIPLPPSPLSVYQVISLAAQ
jgi:hypothetical protein